MKKKEFYILMYNQNPYNDSKFIVEPVKGYIFEIENNSFYVSKRKYNLWVITCTINGLKVCDGTTRTGAINNLKNNFYKKYQDRMKDKKIEVYETIYNLAINTYRLENNKL